MVNRPFWLTLWEHFVLNEIHAALQTRRIHYWRDKRGHEVDFVLTRRGGNPIAEDRKDKLLVRS